MNRIELLMDAAAIDRTLSRIAHQILERNSPSGLFGVVGLQTRGVFIARRIASKIKELTGFEVPTGVLDTTLYRDDFRTSVHAAEVRVTDLPFSVDGMDLVLCDDVLYTGRTVRAALDAIIDFGRPRTIQLAVLVDRGHHELPIRADFVGRKMTTLPSQAVALSVTEIDTEDSLWLTQCDEVN